MPIAVRTICSDCGFSNDRRLAPDEKEIACPACGRRMPNLTKEDFEQIGEVQKKQKTWAIVCFVLVALTVGAIAFWVGSPASWVSTDSAEYWKRVQTNREPNTPALVIASAFAIAAMVFGILASRKRYFVEY